MSQRALRKWKRTELSHSEIQNLWKQLKVTPVDAWNEEIEELLCQLRLSHVNGGAEFAKFHLSNTQILHWYLCLTSLAEMKFFDYFLTLPEVITALPNLQIKNKLTAPIDLQDGSAFTLDGELAACLVYGGAYEKFKDTPCQAKILAQKSSEVLTDGRYDEIRVYKSYNSWSAWFHDVAWDVTWFGIDEQNDNEAYIWVLCLTDTD